MLDIPNWEQLMSFPSVYIWGASWMSFTLFYWQLIWSHVFFLSAMPNNLLTSLKNVFYLRFRDAVTYWPSTGPSIKRCTCVNKRKNSRARWVSNKNITRTQTAWVSWKWSQLVTRCRIENQQTEGFGPSVTHGWAALAKMRKKCCDDQKNFESI